MVECRSGAAITTQSFCGHYWFFFDSSVLWFVVILGTMFGCWRNCDANYEYGGIGKSDS